MLEADRACHQRLLEPPFGIDDPRAWKTFGRGASQDDLLRCVHHSRIAIMPNCPSCNGPNSPGTTLCRSCGASIPESGTLTADLEREVRSLLDQGKKIEAVKVYKDRTGASLKDAKDAVESFQCGAKDLSKRIFGFLPGRAE